MTTYAQNKQHIYNWVEKNREHHYEVVKKYKSKNREVFRLKALWYNEVRREFKLFLRILL
jgi:hypothetical protein